MQRGANSYTHFFRKVSSQASLPSIRIRIQISEFGSEFGSVFRSVFRCAVACGEGSSCSPTLCACIWIRFCMHICIQICIRIWIQICIQMSPVASSQMPVLSSLLEQTSTCTPMLCGRIWMQIRIQICIRICIHICIRICIRSCTVYSRHRAWEYCTLQVLYSMRIWIRIRIRISYSDGVPACDETFLKKWVYEFAPRFCGRLYSTVPVQSVLYCRVSTLNAHMLQRWKVVKSEMWTPSFCSIGISIVEQYRTCTVQHCQNVRTYSGTTDSTVCVIRVQYSTLQVPLHLDFACMSFVQIFSTDLYSS